MDAKLALKDSILNVKVDSLQTELTKLHITVDSLNDTLKKFGTASEYFHDIVSNDVTIFSVIVGLILTAVGLISYKVIADTVSKVKKKLSKQLDEQSKQLTTNKLEFETQLNEFEGKYVALTHHANRLMLLSSRENEVFHHALEWALQCIITEQKGVKPNPDFWLEDANDILDNYLTKDKLKRNFKEILVIIDEIIQSNSDNTYLLEQIELIKEKCYKIIYAEEPN